MLYGIMHSRFIVIRDILAIELADSNRKTQSNRKKKIADVAIFNLMHLVLANPY